MYRNIPVPSDFADNQLIFIFAHPNDARMAESVDALVSNTSGAIRAGSTPAPGTLDDTTQLIFSWVVSFKRRCRTVFLCGTIASTVWQSLWVPDCTILLKRKLRFPADKYGEEPEFPDDITGLESGREIDSGGEVRVVLVVCNHCGRIRIEVVYRDIVREETPAVARIVL